MYSYFAEAAAPQAYPGIYRDLMSVGLLGAVYRCGDDASIVCDAVAATLADGSSFAMVRAIACGLGGDEDFAVRLLTTQFGSYPEADPAKVSLAVSMLLTGNPTWRAPLDNVLASSIDPGARQAVHDVLAFVEKMKR